MNKKPGGWQLINGVWTQVWAERVYDYESGRHWIAERLFPEPAVTLATAAGLMRSTAFNFMRYW